MRDKIYKINKPMIIANDNNVILCEFRYGDVIPEVFACMKIKRMTGNKEVIKAIVNYSVEALYNSKERCIMDGYNIIDNTKLFYTKSNNGYSFAEVVGW